MDSAIVVDSALTFSWTSHQLDFITNFVNTPVQPGNPITTGTANGSLTPVWTATQTTNIPAGGDLQLGFQFPPAPDNDDVEKAFTLTGSRTHVSASNTGAGKQTGEPDHLGNPGGSSVWYSWKAPASGRVTLSTNNLPPYLPRSVGMDSFSLEITAVGPPTCGNEIDQTPPPAFYPVSAAYTGTQPVRRGCLVDLCGFSPPGGAAANFAGWPDLEKCPDNSRPARLCEFCREAHADGERPVLPRHRGGLSLTFLDVT